jgi:tRNA nucleotidyltransferase (CCA-adding enzyme)
VKSNLSEKLRQSLSLPQLDLVQLVASEATALGYPLYMVGGLVRDLLLDRPNLDIDLVVEGDAPTLAHALLAKYGGEATVHSRFGTAKWDTRGSRFWRRESAGNIDPRPAIPESLDLVSARSETYKHPGALPTVKMGEIEDDLRRRDFTINTLAIRLDGTHFGDLRDDFGGVEDLRGGLVRVLHDHSFIDDPTRMYRAARYEKRFGFKIVNETLDLIPGSLALIGKISAQRIRHELDLILDETNKRLILARLADLGLLKPIHAALPWDKSVEERFRSPARPDLMERGSDDRVIAWILWLMGLSNQEISALNKRLHFTALLLKNLSAASKLFADLHFLEDRRPSECVEYLDEIPLHTVYAVYLGAPVGKAKIALERYLGEWRHIKPKVTGSDLKRRGLPPGPAYRKILTELRNAWLDREVQDAEGEKRRLEEALRRR